MGWNCGIYQPQSTTTPSSFIYCSLQVQSCGREGDIGGKLFLGDQGGGLGVMCLVLVSWQQHGAEGLYMQGEEKPAGIWGLQEPAS